MTQGIDQIFEKNSIAQIRAGIGTRLRDRILRIRETKYPSMTWDRMVEEIILTGCNVIEHVND